MRSLLSIAVFLSAALLTAAQQEEKPAAKMSDSSAPEANLVGHWNVEGLTLTFAKGDKETFSEKGEQRICASISENSMTLMVGNKKFAELTYTLNPHQTPAAIDAKCDGRELLGIYEIKDNTLFLRLNDAKKGRPKSLDDKTVGVSLDLTRAESDAVLILNADGSPVEFFEPFPEYNSCGSPRWSRDGGKITFDAWRSWCGEDASWAHVIIVNADGTSFKDLGEGALPNFSPGDKLITFCQYRSNRGVWIMNADGSQRKLIDASGWCSDWASQDEVVYQSYGNDGANLRVTNIKTAATRLLLSGGRYQQIYWGLSTSTDGRWICFKGITQDGNGELAIVSTEGKDKGFKVLLSNSTPDVESFDHYVNWTPDGKHVTALVQRKGSSEYQMVLLDVEGKEAMKPVATQDSSYNRNSSSYSPDGKRIVTIHRWEKLNPSKKVAEKQ